MKDYVLVLVVALVAGCADTKFKGFDGSAAGDSSPPQQQDLRPLGWEWRAPPPPKYLIYAHTDTTLFQADPSVQPITLTPIGTFDCVGGQGQDKAMTDLAVDKDGKLFGISQTAVHPLEVNGSTVHCATSWHLPSGAPFYGLTFAPAGVLQAGEMLVAANSAGELWAIDSTGKTTQVGTFGNVPANDGHGHTYKNAGKPWELSGDIVFLTNPNGEMHVGFATVRDCPSPPSTSNCDTTDTLVQINMAALKLGNTSSVTWFVRGQVVKQPGCAADPSGTGYGSMFGIAAWNDKVYGFSRNGDLVEISNQDGSACLIRNYSGDQFAGAAVTTMAPVKPPPLQ